MVINNENDTIVQGLVVSTVGERREEGRLVNGLLIINKGHLSVQVPD